MITLRLATQKYPEHMQSKEKLSVLLNDLLTMKKASIFVLGSLTGINMEDTEEIYCGEISI